MTKWIVGLVVLIIIVGAGWFFRHNVESLFGQGTPQTPPATVSTDPTAGWATYASSTGQFSIKYPAGYTLNASYEYTDVSPTKPIAGVSLTIPDSMATGTNLSSDSYISVEQLPHAQNCTGDIFLAANVTAVDVSDNGVNYSVASSTGAGAGNRYDETVWAIPGSQPCTAVRYFVHYGVFENWPAGTITQFNEASVDSAFDQIRRTLVMSGTNGVMPPTSTETSTSTQ